MQRSGFHFRANEMRDTTLFNGILSNLKNEAGIRSGKYFKGRSLKQSQDKLDALDVEYRQAITDWQNKQPGASDEIVRVRREMNKLVKDSELKVYDDLLYLIEGKSKKEGEDTVHTAGIPKLLQDKFLEIKRKNPSKAQRIQNCKESLKLTSDIDFLKLFP